MSLIVLRDVRTWRCHHRSSSVRLELSWCLGLQLAQAPTDFGDQSVEGMMCAQCNEHEHVFHAVDHTSNSCQSMQCWHPCHSLFHLNCPATQADMQCGQAQTREESAKWESFLPQSSDDCFTHNLVSFNKRMRQNDCGIQQIVEPVKVQL